jgi:hypothetical protein
MVDCSIIQLARWLKDRCREGLEPLKKNLRIDIGAILDLVELDILRGDVIVVPHR